MSWSADNSGLPPLYLRQIYKLQSLGSFPLLIQYWPTFSITENRQNRSLALKQFPENKKDPFCLLPQSSNATLGLWQDSMRWLVFFFLNAGTRPQWQTNKHTKNTSRCWTRCLGRGRCLSRTARYTSRLSYRLFVLKGILWHFDQYSVKCLISLQWIWSCRHRKSVERGTSGMVSFKNNKTARTFNTSLIPVRLCFFSLYKKLIKKPEIPNQL